MFSQEFKKYAEEKYNARVSLFGDLNKEITKKIQELSECKKERALLMKFLYGTMPLRDAGEYDFSVFLTYVDHALKLRKEMPWCQELPEDLFLHYVLYYRINTENINPCRTFFYQQLKDRIFGKTMEEAVLEINYWCAEQASYAASDERTLSPMGVYFSGTGRCGEESTFTVSALRSVGIPARQVYAPWWAHCDDNHAWVETYINGNWQFLGACEPEEVLNKGWFLGAASRALLISSRTFFDYWMPESKNMLQTDYIGKEGNVYYYNSTTLYAKTRRLHIHVVNKDGIPQDNAEVILQVMNMAEYKKLAKLTTNEDGLASITIGFGDIRIQAYKNGWMGEINFSVKEQDRICIQLIWNTTPYFQKITDNHASYDSKYQETINAPTDSNKNKVVLSKTQQENGRKKRKEAAEKRAKKLIHYFDEEKASKFPEEKEILETSKGNFHEIFQFLSADSNPDRKNILHSLSKKDYKDVTALVLEAFLNNPYINNENLSHIGKNIYIDYILCPRIYNEELSPYPPFIHSYFSEKQLEAFRKNPFSVWDYIEKNIEDIPGETYGMIYSTPIGCLKIKKGNLISKKILFTAILRSIGIPARLCPENMELEVYIEEIQGKPSWKKKISKKKGTLLLSVQEGSKWIYHQTWTIGKFHGIQLETLNYDGIFFENNKLSLELEEGSYQIITTNRVPNGNQHALFYRFTIKEDAKKQLFLSMSETKTEDLLCNHKLPDFEITTLTGNAHQLSEEMNDENNILAFLEVGQEPTEHVLNEMLSQKDILKNISAKILFILREIEDIENTTLKAVLKEFPNIHVFFDKDFNNREPIARSMYVDPEKLPLLVASKEGMTGIYGCSGYNVGSVNLICKIISL